MHFIHITIILDLKIFKMNVQNLEQNLFTFEIVLSNVLNCFCPSFVLYLSVHITSFLKQFISARICFLNVTTKLGANYLFLDVCFHQAETITEHTKHKHT